MKKISCKKCGKTGELAYSNYGDIIYCKDCWCPKCHKEIKGARFYIKELKAWICNSCYLKEK